MSIADTIRNLFAKKKEDDLNAPALKAPPVPQIQPTAPQTNTDMLGSIKNAIGNFFAPVPDQVRIRDVARELPAQTYNFAKNSILQPMARSIPETVMSIGQAVSPSHYQPHETPKSGIGNFLLGDKPLSSVQYRTEDLSQKYGIPKPLAGGAVMLGTLLDLPGQPTDLVEAPVKKGIKNLLTHGVEKLATKEVSEAVPKIALKSAEDVVSAIAKEFKVSPVSVDGPAVKLDAQAITDLIKSKYDVGKGLLEDLLKKDKVTSADSFVMQNKDGGVVLNLMEDFKNTLLDKPKNIMEKSAGIDLTSVSKPKSAVKFNKDINVNFLDTSEYIKQVEQEYDSTGLTGLVQARSGGRRSIGKLEMPPTNNTEVIASIKNDILSGKQVSPVLIDESNKILKNSETAQALKELNIKTVPVVVQRNAGKNVPINQSKAGFDQMQREADRIMKEDFGLLTPAQADRSVAKASEEVYKGRQQLDQMADKELVKGTIDLAGKGDVVVPTEVLKSIEKMKDKQGITAMFSYNRESPTRNIEDILGGEAKPLKDFIFDKVKKDTQDINNFVATVYKDLEDNVVKKLGITRGSELDKLVMDFGEKKITLDELKLATPDWQKVVDADTHLRGVYDGLLNRINETITKYGYDPIPARQNYYTHFQEVGNLFEQLGIINKTEQLPTALQGLTADFKPGKQFFTFAQPRVGGMQYEKSALGAIQKYIEPAAGQIFRTETIQRGRAFEKVLNEAIQKNPNLSDTYLSNFMSWYRDWLNTVAGKKNMGARSMEQDFGRGAYGIMQKIKTKVSANLVGGSVSSALTNFIPLTQAAATTSKDSFLKGLIKSTVDPLDFENNFIVDGVQSQFLRNRFAPEKFAPTKFEAVTDSLSALFKKVDEYVSSTVVSGKYFEQIKAGLQPEQAMKIADEYGAKVITDRSFGQMPQYFADKGWKSFLLQFQAEVNNQMSFIAKDIPQMAGQDPKKIASMVGQLALYSWMFNNVYQKVFGRRPAFDPIDATLYTLEKSNSNETPTNKIVDISKRWGDYLPFSQLLTGGGRLPITAGVPSMNDIADNPTKAFLKPLLVYGPPSSGYQLYKTINGLSDYTQGYTDTRDGRIKYLIEQDAPNFVRAVLAGQYGFPEAQEYFREGSTPYGINDTIVLKRLLEANPDKAIKVEQMMSDKREIDKELGNISQLKNGLKLILADPNVSPEDKERAKLQFQKDVQRVVDAVKKMMIKKKGGRDETSMIEQFFHLFSKEVYAAEDGGSAVPSPTPTQVNQTIPAMNVAPTQMDASSLGNVSIPELGIKKFKGISIGKIGSIKKPSSKGIQFKIKSTRSRVKTPTPFKLDPLPKGVNLSRLTR